MDLNNLLNVYPNILLSDFLRYFLVAGAAFLIFWIGGKKRLHHRFIQKKFPRIQRLWYEFRYSMSTVVIFSINGMGIVWAKSAGYTLIYSDILEYGLPYFFISLLLALLFHDAYFYWTHRLMHHPRLYKHVHRVHHLSTNPSPWAAYSFHPWEALIQTMGFTIMVNLIPLHSLALFLFLTYMITRDVLGHLGYELFPKGFVASRWLNWHTTSTHHNMHHKYFTHNYGLYFSWWDDLMKTTHPQYQQTFDEVTNRSKDNEK